MQQRWQTGQIAARNSGAVSDVAVTELSLAIQRATPAQETARVLPVQLAAPAKVAEYPPADLARLDAANKASGVLSTSAMVPANKPNAQPNPYTTDAQFFKLPPGRKMGATSGVAVDSQGHVWVADRCGTTDCAGSSLDPIMEFDSDGRFLKAFGGGQFLFPHGFLITSDDHIWVADSGCTYPPAVNRSPEFLAACTNGRTGDGKGNVIMEFDRDGKLLLELGTPGVVGNRTTTFNQPSAIQVASNGDIFVSDSHEAGPGYNARIVKFDRTGKFLKQWGSQGLAGGQFDGPHCLAMDTRGRLYVGDRWNNRIEVFDQEGKLLQILTQFGRPSGIFIDKNDVLYSTDSESRSLLGYGYNPGWLRGIRIGRVDDGIVTAFIPDTGENNEQVTSSGGEGIWSDRNGVVYSAQPRQRSVARYVKK